MIEIISLLTDTAGFTVEVRDGEIYLTPGRK
jgi:hypothetical protein